MNTWKSKIIEKQKKGVTTPGRAKGEGCKADVMDRYFAKRSRSYKHKDYHRWCEKCDKINRGY